VIFRLSMVWKMSALAGLLAFSYLVWPTPYRYDHIRFGSASTVARTSRLAGNSEVLDGNKWLKVRAAEGPEEDLGSADLKKLTGNAQLGYDGQLRATLYNGSEFKLKEVTVEVAIREKGGEGAPAAQPEPPPKSSEEEPQTTLEKVESLPWVPREETVSGRLYNEKNGKMALDRLYRMTPTLGGGDSLVVSSFGADLGVSLDSGNGWEWRIVSAKGIRVH
jgi:hypothetical protein